MDQERIKFLASKTNGAVFDENCEQVTELDYPDLYYYDQDAALFAREFMEKTSHILDTGHNFNRGDQAPLLEWHVQSCCNIYGIKKRKNNLRRYHFEFIFLPKKQSKSPYSSIRSKYHLIADGQSRGFIIALAADKENGKIIHDYAKDLIKVEEEVGKDFLTKRLVVRRDDIFHPKSRSRFKVMSADVKNKHGYKLTTLFIDEPHAWEPEHTAQERWATFSKGIIATPEPLVSLTSTAGFKGTWFHKDRYDYAKQLLNGHIRDDRWLVFIYEPDVQALIEKYGEEWDDEKGLKPWYAYEHVWKETNPAYGVTVMPEYFEGEVNAIRNKPEGLNDFLRLHLNVFTGTTVEWTIANKWNRCRGDVVFSDLRGRKCFAAAYTAKPGDLTSFCLFFPGDEDAGEKHKFFWKFFAPRTSSNAKKGQMAEFSQWVKDNHVIEVDGGHISMDEHYELMSKYLEHVECQAIYGPPQQEEFLQKFKDNRNIEYSTMSVTAGDIKKATYEFQRMVMDGEMEHAGNPMIGYQIGMTEIQMKADTIRPDADKSRTNICGVFAGLLALTAWMDVENTESVYEQRAPRWI